MIEKTDELSSPQEIHVSPKGRRDAPGHETQQTTLTEALRRCGDAAGSPARVILHDGVYDLDQTLVFTPRHSGRADLPLRWQAAPGARPTLASRTPLTGWKKLDHEVPGLPAEASDKVWYVDVPDADFRTLYHGERMLERARIGPFFSDVDRRDECTDRLLCPKREDMDSWADATDVELFVMPRFRWQAQYLPIERMDRARVTVTTRVPGTYFLHCPGNGQPPQSYWLDNVAEGITGPGRWRLDRQSGRLYLWPPEGDEPADIHYPALSELIRFEGEAGEPCSHIELSGLTFMGGDRIDWPEKREAIQHDWQVYDWPDAMVRLRGARNVAVRHCRFVDAGATGLRMDGFAVGNAVERCTFERLGGNAVALIGDRPGRREVSHHNTIRTNVVRDVGRLWWQASGIILCQSGCNTVTDNLVYDLPYCGITLVSGRDGFFLREERDLDGKDGNPVPDDPALPGPAEYRHIIGHLACRNNLVAHNEVHHVMLRLGDGNGIYISGTGWGNVIEANYVHDLPASGTNAGIRTDDWQWYTRVCGNVVCRINGGGLLLKDINDMTDNVIVDCMRDACLMYRRSPMWGANVKRNILYLNDVPDAPGQEGEPPDPPKPYFTTGRIGTLEEPNSDDNLLWCVADPACPETCLKVMRDLGQEAHSIVADPKFVDAGNDDYRLTPDSPALDLGIRSLESWGVRGAVGAEPAGLDAPSTLSVDGAV